MRKIYALVIVFLALSINAFCQANAEKEVAAAVEVLKKAIVDANKDQLESIAADDLVYAHSSGRVQNKAEFIAEIIDSQHIDYVSIELSDQTIKIAGDVAIVRHIYSAVTSTRGTPGNIKIGNMLIWQKQQGKWKLLARQAYKLS